MVLKEESICEITFVKSVKLSFVRRSIHFAKLTSHLEVRKESFGINDISSEDSKECFVFGNFSNFAPSGLLDT